MVVVGVGLDELLQDAVIRLLAIVEEFEKFVSVHEFKIGQIFEAVIVAIVFYKCLIVWLA